MFGVRFLKRYLYLRDLDIVVETSNACNARCVWCWMYNSGRKETGLMAEEDFKRFIDLNAGLLKNNQLMPYHRGEALIHPRILEMLEYAHQKESRFGNLNTNLSCEIDLERLCALPFTLIIVNVGGATKEVHEKVIRRTNWEIVTDNLRRLFKLSAKYDRRVQVKMNVTRHNVHQVGDLADLVIELGGRAEDAIIGTTGFTLPALATREEKADFFHEVVSDKIESYLRFTYDLSRDDFDIRAKGALRLCRFIVPAVKFDGRVTICCHDQLDRLNLGNAFETPLADILRSRQYLLTLSRGVFKAFDFCKECN